ncbi:DNA-3-methyladenine glycosylase family protein [Cryptosporangium sp. NPDC048952]|uniref:DNA-3-methyladenine glycosylase family protein n=1 Tax=Cryptosporangium sp. NPDC048952 TaxID=3363961 RepID=UPI00371EFC0D
MRTELPVVGPWSLRTSKRFWEEFAPAAIPAGGDPDVLDAQFLSEHDWTPVTARVAQHGTTARLELSGDGDLDAAAGQVTRFLSLDVDATGWPAIGDRDPVIADAQRTLPGFRPCGFHSPYEAAAWAVLSQRTRVSEAARVRERVIAEHGRGGAFPAPADLIAAVGSGRLVLPGRKGEYLVAVAEAALGGALDGPVLRGLPEEEARARLSSITGIGPFAADLVLIRGANAVDVLPRAERRLDAEIERRYGPGTTLDDVAAAWRPFRSWAAVHLRALGAG